MFVYVVVLLLLLGTGCHRLKPKATPPQAPATVQSTAASPKAVEAASNTSPNEPAAPQQPQPLAQQATPPVSQAPSAPPPSQPTPAAAPTPAATPAVSPAQPPAKRAEPAPGQPAATPAPKRPAAPTPSVKPAAPTPATGAPEPTPKAAPDGKRPEPPVAKSPAATPTLDLTGLTEKVKSTSAIGFLTKLTLKNQVGDLVDDVRDYHAGKSKLTATDLRRAFDLLMMKVLSLLQDKDPGLASSIVSSREALWDLLADPKKFATLPT